MAHSESGKLLSNAQGNTQKLINLPVKVTGTEKLVAASSAVMSLGMALTSAKGIIDTWNNTELTFGEKLITTMTSGGMAITMLV